MALWDAAGSSKKSRFPDDGTAADLPAMNLPRSQVILVDQTIKLFMEG
jgi:hypothetical protein